jgi:sulfonate transport system substrate-binding protein
MHRRHVIGLVLTGLFTGSSIARAAESLKAEGLKEVRIGYQKGGIFPAVKQRRTVEEAFGPLGIEVRWVEFAFGPPLLEALNTGNIDFGTTGDAPPIFAQAASANLLYVAALPSSGSNEAIVVPDNSQIRTLGELKGRKVGFGKGSSAHNTTLAALEKAGLTYADIRPVYLAPADAVAAFAQGSLDAWTIWDPFLALAERHRGARVLAYAGAVHTTSAFFLANREFTGRNPEIVATLNRIFARESEWAGGHKAEVSQAQHEATGVELEAVRRAVDRATFQVVPMNEQIVARQQTIADRFHKLGLIPGPINVRDIVWTWTPNS